VRKTKREERPGPIADYIEWTEHRFDPGYYLGGRIPPHLKTATLGPKGRRRMGVLLSVFGGVGLSTAPFPSSKDIGDILLASFLPALCLTAGVRMLLSRGSRKEQGGGDKRQP
jgi:hypothetical protein